MALNVVNALLSGELGLDTVKVDKAKAWDAQIKGAYCFLYPYIAEDFRGVEDCSFCHNELAITYITDSPGVRGNHSKLPTPDESFADEKIDRSITPTAKQGGDNVGTYET